LWKGYGKERRGEVRERRGWEGVYIIYIIYYIMSEGCGDLVL